jgi:signal transduction histidine kinase
MKFFQSIRWRLQLWYGLLLALLLGGFGVTAYQLESARQLRRIDEELQQRLPLLVKSQRPSRANREIREFALTPKDAALFDQEGGGAFYYVVWLRHGEPVTRSATAPREVPEPQPGTPPNRRRGDFRETFLFPGPGDCVLVGRSVSRDLADLRQLAWWLGGVGATVLLLGLAGGAWLVSRALRPIGEITSAAETISSGDLTRRIITADSGSELGQLAEVLNSTFARLDAAFTRQARFTADAAHELRTPLAVMLTHVQNGLASDGLTEEQREAFEASQRAAQRMRRLTESLLTLARLDSDTATRSACDLAQLVREAAEPLQPLAVQQQLSLETDLSSASCSGNAEQLAQVITNLVSNAISYNRPGGRVQVRTFCEPGTAILSVSDTGRGISPADLPHVFERFYRADKVRSGRAGRSGLGLAITRAIVDAHGGAITATSEPGQGSTFTVRLPLAGSV